jgi:hypothetical protein
VTLGSSTFESRSRYTPFSYNSPSPSPSPSPSSSQSLLLILLRSLHRYLLILFIISIFIIFVVCFFSSLSLSLSASISYTRTHTHTHTHGHARDDDVNRYDISLGQVGQSVNPRTQASAPPPLSWLANWRAHVDSASDNSHPADLPASSALSNDVCTKKDPLGPRDQTRWPSSSTATKNAPRHVLTCRVC